MMAPVYLKRVGKKRDQPIKDTRGFRAKLTIIAQTHFVTHAKSNPIAFLSGSVCRFAYIEGLQHGKRIFFLLACLLEVGINNFQLDRHRADLVAWHHGDFHQ